MKMVKVSDLFDVRYGTNLELVRLEPDEKGIAFVSRTERNNGVSCRVRPVPGLSPIPAGVLTVAGGGSVLETFLQPEPFYSGRDLYCLAPKHPMSDQVKLFYAACIRANKFRYSYGRQANRTLKNMEIPDLSEVPAWVQQTNIAGFGDAAKKTSSSASPPALNVGAWLPFKLQDLFDIRKGKRLTKAAMVEGKVPFIGASDANNGTTGHVGQSAIHEGNVISVAYNGSVAETFYQPAPFWASDDVNVLYPKGFAMSPQIGMFLATVIRLEKYRFSYGRKWHLERMRESEIRLPVKKDGSPDWGFIEDYVKTLPFSSALEKKPETPMTPPQKDMEPGIITYYRNEAMRVNPEGVKADEARLAGLFGKKPPTT